MVACIFYLMVEQSLMLDPGWGGGGDMGGIWIIGYGYGYGYGYGGGDMGGRQQL